MDDSQLVSLARQMCADYRAHLSASGSTNTATELVRDHDWTWAQAGALQKAARTCAMPLTSSD